jgi:hypothetical protein
LPPRSSCATSAQVLHPPPPCHSPHHSLQSSATAAAAACAPPCTTLKCRWCAAVACSSCYLARAALPCPTRCEPACQHTTRSSCAAPHPLSLASSRTCSADILMIVGEASILLERPFKVRPGASQRAATCTATRYRPNAPTAYLPPQEVQVDCERILAAAAAVSSEITPRPRASSPPSESQPSAWD